HRGGTASGEVIRTDGYILPNNHVIAGAANGGNVYVLFSDGTSVRATVAGRDILTDLAVGRDRRPGRQRRHPAGRRDHEDRRRRRDEQPPARDAHAHEEPRRHGRHRLLARRPHRDRDGYPRERFSNVIELSFFRRDAGLESTPFERPADRPGHGLAASTKRG